MQNYFSAFYFGEFKPHGLDTGLISRHESTVLARIFKYHSVFKW